MSETEKKGITVKIDADLHAQVRQYIEANGMTMAEFVSKALDDELHPKTTIKEEKYMGNMRTMAFQVPEDLFLQIKDYLDRHHMTQKQFVLGLIQDELDRDYEEQQAMAEKQQSEDEPDEDEDEELDERCRHRKNSTISQVKKYLKMKIRTRKRSCLRFLHCHRGRVIMS